MKVRIRFSSSDKNLPAVEIESFFVGIDARVEFPESGFGIKLGETVCLDCGKHIRQTTACSDGTGTLRCECSHWICPVSMGSGTAYTQSGLRRTAKITDREKAEKILRDLPVQVVDELRVCLTPGKPKRKP